MKRKLFGIRYIAVMAMMIAICYVAVLLCKGIPQVSGFLSYEPKDVLIVIVGFLFGPLSSVIVAALTSLLEWLTISDTGPIGFLMNVIASCAFAVPAAWFYQKDRTQKGAVLGLVIGVLTMAVAMVAWNYIITPLYMNVSRETVAGMLVSVFLPFNLVKGGLNAGLTLLLYKPLVGALRKTGLVERSEAGKKGKFSPGFFLFSLAVLATFVLLFLGMIGII